jgi:uncharacterized protein YuzE
VAKSWHEHAEYDPDADAIYVYLRDAKVVKTVAIDDFRNIDYDGEGRVVGVEFLDVSGGIDLHDVPFAHRVGQLISDLNLGIRVFA